MGWRRVGWFVVAGVLVGGTGLWIVMLALDASPLAVAAACVAVAGGAALVVLLTRRYPPGSKGPGDHWGWYAAAGFAAPLLADLPDDLTLGVLAFFWGLMTTALVDAEHRRRRGSRASISAAA